MRTRIIEELAITIARFLSALNLDIRDRVKLFYLTDI